MFLRALLFGLVFYALGLHQVYKIAPEAHQPILTTVSMVAIVVGWLVSLCVFLTRWYREEDSLLKDWVLCIAPMLGFVAVPLAYLMYYGVLILAGQFS